MNEELKPCPFCGCDVHLERYEYPNKDKAWRLGGWRPDNCLFEVSFTIPENTNKRELIKAWNRRTNNG